MLDFGWSELIVIVLVLIVVVGPHDLPKVMRAIAEIIGKARHLANRFRADMDALAREVELEELRRKVKLFEAQNPNREMAKLIGVDPNERITLDEDELPGAPVPADTGGQGGAAEGEADAGEGESGAPADTASPTPQEDTAPSAARRKAQTGEQAPQAGEAAAAKAGERP